MPKFPPIERVLFLDIETAPIYHSLSEVPEPLRDHWRSRYQRHLSTHSEEELEEHFLDKSGIHALYSRIVCIGLGYFRKKESKWYWREIALADLNEVHLLKSFADKWNRFSLSCKNSAPLPNSKEPLYAVCGHNIRNFDIPFLGRRLLISGVPLPDFWREAQDAQPWQLNAPMLIDTMLLWNFTARENSFIPLELLANALGIAFQKSLSHDQIREAFYKWEATGSQSEFQPVLDYCLQDVRTVAHIYLRMQGEPSEEKEQMLRFEPMPENP